MNAAYLSAIAALAGSVIGGLTSLLTSFLTLRVQSKSQLIAREIEKRELIYGNFIDEASKIYSEALTTEKQNIAVIANLYAIFGRMRLFSSDQVVHEAENAIRKIVDAYFSPNITLNEIRQASDPTSIDPLLKFGEACRIELRALRSGRGM